MSVTPQWPCAHASSEKKKHNNIRHGGHKKTDCLLWDKPKLDSNPIGQDRKKSNWILHCGTPYNTFRLNFTTKMGRPNELQRHVVTNNPISVGVRLACRRDRTTVVPAHASAHDEKPRTKLNSCSLQLFKNPFKSQNWALEVFLPQCLADLVPTLNLLPGSASFFGIPHFSTACWPCCFNLGCGR